MVDALASQRLDTRLYPGRLQLGDHAVNFEEDVATVNLKAADIRAAYGQGVTAVNTTKESNGALRFLSIEVRTRVDSSAAGTATLVHIDSPSPSLTLQAVDAGGQPFRCPAPCDRDAPLRVPLHFGGEGMPVSSNFMFARGSPPSAPGNGCWMFSGRFQVMVVEPPVVESTSG